MLKLVPLCGDVLPASVDEAGAAASGCLVCAEAAASDCGAVATVWCSDADLHHLGGNFERHGWQGCRLGQRVLVWAVGRYVGAAAPDMVRRSRSAGDCSVQFGLRRSQVVRRCSSRLSGAMSGRRPRKVVFGGLRRAQQREVCRSGGSESLMCLLHLAEASPVCSSHSSVGFFSSAMVNCSSVLRESTLCRVGDEIPVVLVVLLYDFVRFLPIINQTPYA